VTILCYHTVEPGWRSPLAIEPAEFERHCAWLSRRRLVPLDAKVAEGSPSPSGTVAITFDDGLSGVYEHAFASLVRHHVPATVFVVAETMVDPERKVDWVDTPPATPLRTITRDQVLEMRDAGIAIASHSHAHLDLTMLTDDEVERDLRTSREVLEDVLHEPVPFLAYPRGRHDDHVRRAAERAGFTHAFSLPEGPEPTGRFAVPRVGVYPGTGVPGLVVKTRPWYLPVRTSRAYPWLRTIVRGGPPPTKRAG